MLPISNSPSSLEQSALYQRWRAIAEMRAGHLALVCDGRPVSYAQLQQKIDAAIGLLKKANAQEAPVVVLFPNGVDFIAAVFAIFAVNGVVVALNPGFTDSEISYYLQSSQAKVIFCSATTSQKPFATGFNGHIFGEDDLQAAPLAMAPTEPVCVDGDKPALYMFSSGSTGKSKRITRGQRQLLQEYQGLAQAVGLTEDERVLCTVPLYHAHGFCNAMLAALLSGGLLVLLTTEFNARKTMQALVDHQISLYPAVPFMFKVLAATRFNPVPNLPALRLLVSAGAPLEASVAEAFYNKFGKAVSQLYGSTETGAITINLHHAIAKPLSVGQALAHVKVEIRDEGGRRLPDGVDGEIWVSSLAMTACYDGLEALSRECFVDGWFFAGDLGHFDEAGCLFISGRKKLLYIVAGNKVDPLEVEAVIGSYHKVAEVVVVGVPHADYGQMIKAFVVLLVDGPCSENEIINHARAGLAEYKVPKAVEFVKEIPRSPLGKILRKYLQ